MRGASFRCMSLNFPPGGSTSTMARDGAVTMKNSHEREALAGVEKLAGTALPKSTAQVKTMSDSRLLGRATREATHITAGHTSDAEGPPILPTGQWQ